MNQYLTFWRRSVGLTTLAATLSWALLVDALGLKLLGEKPPRQGEFQSRGSDAVTWSAFSSQYLVAPITISKSQDQSCLLSCLLAVFELNFLSACKSVFGIYCVWRSDFILHRIICDTDPAKHLTWSLMVVLRSFVPANSHWFPALVVHSHNQEWQIP